MTTFKVYLWKRAPAIRLLIPFMAGVVVQWYLSLPLPVLLLCTAFCLVGTITYNILPLSNRWRLAAANGVLLTLLIAAAGAVLTYGHDIRHDANWIGHKKDTPTLITLQEPLVEKANSYKAIATVQAVVDQHQGQKASGAIIVYFKKDSTAHNLGYGSQLVVGAPLQLIKNAGNPGGFDYQRYNLFQGVTHQVYLTPDDWVVLPQKRTQAFQTIIYQCRQMVVNRLYTYIKGEREQGLAAALLIGYKDDLDKNLVQSYSNTGVVHIIAISGLHLGLIYWILLLLTAPLKRHAKTKGIRIVIVIIGLWLFSIVAGAHPSVLRSAVMFSFIALAQAGGRKTYVYNTLALSALLLLCYNPFWLWDVGFQLSYTAVLSIMLFFQPIYQLVYFKNKAVDFVWKLMAVTLSAQIFTLPISIYHFHQVPVLFLFTNLVAVPLASIVLIGEILLVALSFIPVFAGWVGAIVSLLLQWMNHYIEQMSLVSFATWNGLSISVLQMVLLLGVMASLCYMWLQKEKVALWVALSFLICFIILRSASFLQANRQQLLIVYNVPKLQAIDIINGRNYLFVGDRLLQVDGFLRNFHLQPSRIVHRTTPQSASINSPIFICHNKRIAVVDTNAVFISAKSRPTVDVLILSKNPRVYIPELNRQVAIRQIVIDGSVPAWKARLWKQDCDSLHLPCYDVAEKGAFVMNL